VVKTIERTPQQILLVPCSICGAAAGEACELHTVLCEPGPIEIGRF
jgi:hypothetical protein